MQTALNLVVCGFQDSPSRFILLPSIQTDRQTGVYSVILKKWHGSKNWDGAKYWQFEGLQNHRLPFLKGE